MCRDEGALVREACSVGDAARGHSGVWGRT